MAGNLNKRSNIVVEPDDRLSFLPPELQSSVLSALPLHVAFKSSILSKMWRKVWQSLPDLIFDYSKFPDMERKLDYFLQFIHQTLVDHDESSIKAFELYLTPRRECRTRIKNEWVTFSVQHNVHKLVLHGKVKRLQQLPECLFTCSSLHTLELAIRRLFLKWPMAAALPNLKKLSLKRATLSDENFMLDLTSSCPALEILSIIACNVMIMKILAISAYRLKELSMAGCQGINNCLIKLDTPNLVHFIYMDNVAQDYSFTNVSSLFFAWFKFSEAPIERRDACSWSTIKALKGLCNVKRLSLDHHFIQFLSRAHHVSRQLSAISFNKLEKLALTVWPVKEQVQMTFLLLGRCAKLHFIMINLSRSEGWTADMLDQDIVSGNLVFPLMFKHLAFVKIQNFEGNESEMELVRLFLENAPGLLNLDIAMARDSNEADLEELSLTSNERNMKMHKISMFKRASDATITFS